MALVTKSITDYSQRRLSKAVLAVNIAAKGVIHMHCTLLKHFSFKSGYVVRVAKHLKEDWFIVLQWQ